MTKIDTSTEAVAALLDDVTGGPWFVTPDGWRVTDKRVTFDEDGARHGETPNIWFFADTKANARFIAAARELVPALIAERDELKAEVARLRRDLAEERVFLNNAVSKSPAPLRELGAYLAGKLDDDDWPEAERYLNAAAKSCALKGGDA